MKIIVFVLVACAVSVLTADSVEDADTEIEFITVKNLTEYLQTVKLNFNLVPLKRDNSNLFQIRYVLGNRINGRQYLVLFDFGFLAAMHNNWFY